ncbi:hypothetical protein MC885_007929, partial [Smutsia gigantea]
MASQPPCAPSSPEAPGKGGTSQRCHARPLSVPASHGDSDTARKFKNAVFPGWLSCMTLVRTCSRFKMSNLEGCRNELLASLDPLTLDEELPPPETHSVLKKFWGDQEPLTKDAVDGSVVREFEQGPRAPVSECSVTADSRSHFPCASDHHERPVTACRCDPDSQRVASVSLDRSIKIWDATSQATLLTIAKAHSNAISNCCFTFSGHFLCTSSWDKTLKIWNVYTGEFRNSGACVTLMKGHEGSVSSCHFARDTSLLVSGGFDRIVAIWDGHNDWVTDVAISNNKKWILSASKDKTLRLWNIEEIDQIPLVIENRKALGLEVKQCEGCDRPFSTYENDVFSETVSKCVFCRMDSKDLSPSSGEDSPARQCSPGSDDWWPRGHLSTGHLP